MVLLHTRQEEADFLTGVVKTFLNDAQLLVAAALSLAMVKRPVGMTRKTGCHSPLVWIPI